MLAVLLFGRLGNVGRLGRTIKGGRTVPGILPTGGPQEGVSGDEGALPGVLSVGDPQEEVSGDDNSFSDAESERVRFNSSLSIYIFSFLYYQYLRFLYKGIIIKHNKTEPTYTKTSLFLCEKRRFFMARTEKGVVATI